MNILNNMDNMESRLDKLTSEILQVSNNSPVIVIDTEKGPEKELVKKLILGYIEFLDENKYTIEEFKNYLEIQDSFGDALYFLSDENINKANQEEE
jgi:predicted house-cleaning noncanonical NTP pyrophosphatase (MazG superfamily)